MSASETRQPPALRRTLVTAGVLAALLVFTIVAAVGLESAALVLVGMGAQVVVAGWFLIDHRALRGAKRWSLIIVGLFALVLLIVPFVTEDSSFLSPYAIEGSDASDAPGGKDDAP